MSALPLFVGAKVDVYCKLSHAWTIGRIVDIKARRVKIHYLGWSHKLDIWRNKDSQHIAPLHTHTLPIILLSKPPYTDCSMGIVHRRKLILVTTNTFEICKYDMDTDEYSNIPFGSISSDRGLNQIAYDAKNSFIYITNAKRPYIIQMNLNNDKITRISSDEHWHLEDKHVPMMVHHEDKNLDVLHAFSFNTHTYYDKDKQRYVNIKENIPNYKIMKPIHVPYLNKIMGIGRWWMQYTLCEFDTDNNCVVKSNTEQPRESLSANDYILSIYKSLIVIIQSKGLSFYYTIFFRALLVVEMKGEIRNIA